MRRPHFLQESDLIPPPSGRRAANAARRVAMRHDRDVGLTYRQAIRLTRRREEAWLASAPPEDRAELVRNLGWSPDDEWYAVPRAVGAGARSTAGPPGCGFYDLDCGDVEAGDAPAIP